MLVFEMENLTEIRYKKEIKKKKLKIQILNFFKNIPDGVSVGARVGAFVGLDDGASVFAKGPHIYLLRL